MHEKKLKLYIKHIPLSIKDLAKDLEISYFYLVNILNNKRSLTKHLSDRMHRVLELEVLTRLEEEWRKFCDLTEELYGMDKPEWHGNSHFDFASAGFRDALMALQAARSKATYPVQGKKDR